MVVKNHHHNDKEKEVQRRHPDPLDARAGRPERERLPLRVPPQCEGLPGFRAPTPEGVSHSAPKKATTWSRAYECLTIPAPAASGPDFLHAPAASAVVVLAPWAALATHIAGVSPHHVSRGTLLRRDIREWFPAFCRRRC